MPTKPKRNYEANSGSDLCQTPPYAVEPLIPYLPVEKLIWEPASGEEMLANALRDKGYLVWSTELARGTNFFDEFPPNWDYYWDILVTNPPYSIKYAWLKRCYELGKPFALLVPVETLGATKAIELFEKYGTQRLYLKGRVDFKMPGKGWGGKGAQFPVMWLCWNLLPEQIMYADIRQAKKEFKALIESKPQAYETLTP